MRRAIERLFSTRLYAMLGRNDKVDLHAGGGIFEALDSLLELIERIHSFGIEQIRVAVNTLTAGGQSLIDFREGHLGGELAMAASDAHRFHFSDSNPQHMFRHGILGFKGDGGKRDFACCVIDSFI